MTNSEAIETLQANYPDPCYELLRDAVDTAIRTLSTQPEIIYCKDCKWWDKKEGSSYGYCHAAKHSYYSRRWEIIIYRTYGADFYCADAELREEEEEEEEEI